MKKTLLLFIVTLSCMSCNKNHGSYENYRDVRKEMYDNYIKNNHDDIENLKITKFAHIGNVTVDGNIYYVIDVSTVIKGMLAPRGICYILLFDTNCNLVEALHPYDTPPLWCEGSRVFLWGETSQNGMCGNAWEFKDGFRENERKLIECPSYGSFEPDEELNSGEEQ